MSTSRSRRKTDEPHRCPKCGETDLTKFSRNKRTKSGYGCYCRACKTAHGRENVKAHMVEALCPYCEKRFMVSKYQHELRAKQRRNLYCSKSCSGFHKREARPRFNLHLFKRQRGWTDEMWHWERKLVALGLGMSVGLSNYVEYGLKHEWDDPNYYGYRK